MSLLSSKIKTMYVLVLYLLTVFLAAPGPAFGGMEAMDDAELDSVCAATGMSLMIKDFAFNYNVDSYTYTDTDTGNSLSLQNVSYDDGAGGRAILQWL